MTELQPETLDLKCYTCGYMLRGLDPAGVCPECGLAITQTIYALDAQRHRRELAVWLRVPRTPAVHPPWSECSAAWLRRVTIATLMLIFVYLCFGCWLPLRGRIHIGKFDSDYVFPIIGVMYLFPACLIALPRKGFRHLGIELACGVAIVVCAISTAIASIFVVFASYELIERDARYWASLSELLALPIVPGICLVVYRIAFIATGAPRSKIGRFAYIPALLAAVGAVRLLMMWPTHYEERIDAGHQWTVAVACYFFPLATLIYVAVLLIKACRSRSPRVPGDDLVTCNATSIEEGVG